MNPELDRKKRGTKKKIHYLEFYLLFLYKRNICCFPLILVYHFNHVRYINIEMKRKFNFNPMKKKIIIKL